ncbi:PspC domain-containing protein [Planomonospora sp. ID91781]|uniref:PspC domain-containing protein n=1 Tax=Planomonospora sp. ID91781 TaxID=2738135 RepID=UPI001A1F43DF|nr:PspC domain-containing protein [Planomonospora sp. ID91781]MBG0820778.1 PspC domain-containing protein [Planomonospora sp. ID91781]
MNDTGSPQGPASTPPDSPSATATAAGVGESADGRRRLRRDDEGRMLTGVCSGLGHHSGVDPVLFRVGFAMLVFASGAGIMLYIAAFLLMREPNGGPGHLEQWTRRDFDGETVLALLAAVFAFGLIVNVSSGGIGTPSVVAGTLFAVALLAAHSRGVDLLALTRSVPERLRGSRRVAPRTEEPPAFPSTGLPYSPPGAGDPHAGTRPPEGAQPYRAEPYPGTRPPHGTPYAQAPDVPSQPAERSSAVEEAIAAAKARMAAAQARAETGRTSAEETRAETGRAPAQETRAEAGQASAEETRAPGTAPAGAHPAGAGVTARLPLPPHDAPAHETSPHDTPAHEASGLRPHEAPAPAFPATYDAPRDVPRTDAPPHGVPVSGLPTGPRRTAVPSFDSSGAPFAPHGPYRPLDPRRRPSPYGAAPFDLAGYGPPPRPAPRPKPPRAFVGVVTMFLAVIVGGIIMAVQSATGSVNMTSVGAAALVTIGAGLIVAAWFGRGAALVAAGTVVALSLVVGSAVSDVPKKFGTYDWVPASVSQLSRTYEVGVGEGRLDLGDLTFPPGSRTVVEATVSVGEITVILPPTVRAEVDGYSKLGDVKIDHVVQGGADIHHERVLEPEVPPEGEVATIVLNVRAGVGDVEVRRAA